MPSGRPLTLANPALAFLIRRRGREEQEPSPVHADESTLRPEGTNQQLLVRSGWVTNGLGPGRPGPINQTKPNRKEVTQPLVFPTVAANATTPGVLTTTRLNHSEVKLKVDATTAGTKLKVSAATVSPMRESQRVLIGFPFEHGFNFKPPEFVVPLVAASLWRRVALRGLPLQHNTVVL